MLIKLDRKRYDEFLINEERKRIRMSIVRGKPDLADLPLWLRAEPFSTKAAPFNSPEELWSAAQAYFEWASWSPIETEVSTFYLGQHKTGTENRPRAFSMKSLATFAGTTVRKIDALRSDDDYAEVLEVIDQIIYTQKFEFAAVGVMNPNFIARDLDMSEKLDLGGGKTPVRTLDVGKLSTSVLEEILNAQNPEEEDG